jgi:hypothetical protein
MKQLILIAVLLFSTGAMAGESIDKWPKKKSTHSGFDYKKHYKKQLKARRKNKSCSMLKDIH